MQQWLRVFILAVRWLLSIFLLLIGVVGILSGDLPSGAGAVIMGTALIPKLRQIGSIALTPWIRSGVVVAGFLALVAGTSQGKDDQIPVPVPVEATDTVSASSTSSVPKVKIPVSNLSGGQEEPRDIVVVAVTDGDTIKVRLMDGIEEVIRIIGIDTPETRPVECFGAEATAKMRTLVDGKVVRLERDPADDRDSFGRLLRYVSVQGEDVGTAMIRDGYAHSYTKYPHPLMEKYNSLERDARLAKRGLWGDVCGEPEVEEEEVATPAPIQAAPITTSTGIPSSQPFQEYPSPTEAQECVIKGNVNSEGEKIYHYPGCGSYSRTKIKPEDGDRWFCTEAEARAAGFRRAGNC